MARRLPTRAERITGRRVGSTCYGVAHAPEIEDEEQARFAAEENASHECEGCRWLRPSLVNSDGRDGWKPPGSVEAAPQHEPDRWPPCAVGMELNAILKWQDIL